MKIFIFSLLIGATLAKLWPTITPVPSGLCNEGNNAKAEIQIDLDYYSYGTAAQAAYEFYWIKYEFQYYGRFMTPVGCNWDTALWEEDWFDKTRSLHIFPGCNYFHVAPFNGLKTNCYNDVDGCSVCGYTFEADINPIRSTSCEPTWLVNFGHSQNNVEYGFYAGFQCSNIIVWSISSTQSMKSICNTLNTNATVTDQWYYLSVVYDPRSGIKAYVDGKEIPCATAVQAQIGAPDKVPEIIVGAAKNGPGSPEIDNMYEGKVNQICWFNRIVSQQEREYMMDKGSKLKNVNSRASCYWIGSVQSYKFYKKL